MTNIQSSNLEDAIEIALKVHKGELREDSENVPLVYHLTQVANLVHHSCDLSGNDLKEALIVSVLHESFNNVDTIQRKDLEESLKNYFGLKIMKNITLFKMPNKGSDLVAKSEIFTKIYHDIKDADDYLIYILIADTISSMIKLIKQFPDAKYVEIDEYLSSLESLVESKNIPKELKFMWHQKCEEVRRLFLNLGTKDSKN